MAKQDEELNKFIGQKIKDIRSATQEEYENIFPEDEYERHENDALMVAELNNGCKLYLLSDRIHETKTGTDQIDQEGTEVAIAETETGEIIEIPE